MFTLQIDAARAAGRLGELRYDKGWVVAPPVIFRRILDAFGGREMVPVYGMSEYGVIAIGNRADPLEERIMNAGAAPPGTELRIADLAGPTEIAARDADEPRIGEIFLRSTSLFDGYFQGRTDELDGEGWLGTGDLGFALDGELYVMALRRIAAHYRRFVRLYPQLAAESARLERMAAELAGAVGAIDQRNAKHRPS